MSKGPVTPRLTWRGLLASVLVKMVGQSDRTATEQTGHGHGARQHFFLERKDRQLIPLRVSVDVPLDLMMVSSLTWKK